MVQGCTPGFCPADPRDLAEDCMIPVYQKGVQPGTSMVKWTTVANDIVLMEQDLIHSF